MINERKYTRYMKDMTAIFAERLEDIQKSLELSNYSVCNRISGDLVRLVSSVELENEVFISEVLESTFSNLEDTFFMYDIPKNIKGEMNSGISEKMRLLIGAYKSNNTDQLYEGLKQLRYVATQHQMNVFLRYNIIKPPRHLGKY